MLLNQIWGEKFLSKSDQGGSIVFIKRLSFLRYIQITQSKVTYLHI